MENPGLVTFNDAYVFTSRGTDAQYQQRANTLMHEMAHMWFGDLVTMRWWDDLWLKESFADYMGTRAIAEATDWGEASWVSFANRRKSWAYVQDQLPTTHPVVADIVDLEAAKQNFDGITYAKGASVLKQLVAYVGAEAFFTAAQRYFREYAFGNTTLKDFLAVLSAASGRDMGEWAQRWLNSSGISTLRLELEAQEGSGGQVIRRAGVHQTATDPVTGRSAQRPHRLNLGSYDHDENGRLVRTDSVPLELDGEWTEVPALTGARRPALLLLNDEDFSYAKVRLDESSLQTLLGSTDDRGGLAAMPDPLARALCWSALWDLCRDGLLSATHYVDAVCRQAPTETEVELLTSLIENARIAVEHYTPTDQRDGLRCRFVKALANQLEQASAGEDTQLAWARGLASAGRSGAGSIRVALVPLLRGILGGSMGAGLTMDADLRWRILAALSALGDTDQIELNQHFSQDRSSVAAMGLQLALAARPLAEAKHEAWQSVLGTAALRSSSRGEPQLELSNDEISARLSGFCYGPETLRRDYREWYFTVIGPVWEQRSIEIASRIVCQLFPGQDAEPGRTAEDHQIPRLAATWLIDHPEAPAALRRIVLEQRDHLLRALRAQQAAFLDY